MVQALWKQLPYSITNSFETDMSTVEPGHLVYFIVHIYTLLISMLRLILHPEHNCKLYMDV